MLVKPEFVIKLVMFEKKFVVSIKTVEYYQTSVKFVKQFLALNYETEIKLHQKGSPSTKFLPKKVQNVASMSH